MSEIDSAKVQAIVARGQSFGLFGLGGEITGLTGAIKAVLPAAADLARVETSHAAAQDGMREAVDALERLRKSALDGYAVDAKRLGKSNSDLATARELAELTEQAVSAAKGRLSEAAEPIVTAIRDEGLARLRSAQLQHVKAQKAVELAHQELNAAYRAETSMQGALDRMAMTPFDAVRLFAGVAG